jgi:hypothetical protein
MPARESTNLKVRSMREEVWGSLPRTRRRSIHDSRNLSRAPAASLRDRLRRPLTEPVCRQVRQQSGSGEGPGQDRVRSRRRRDLGDGDQDQELTATVTATAATTSKQQRSVSVTADNARTIQPTGDMSGLKSGRSLDSLATPRTWPTHYGRVPPRCPRTTINSQRSPPAATCEHEAGAGYGHASNAREHPRNA